MLLTKYKFELTNSLERLIENKEQIELVNEDIKFSRRYLNLLVERLHRELDEKIKEDESLSDYDSPNWALIKAERLGYRKAIRKVIDIIRPIEVKHD